MLRIRLIPLSALAILAAILAVALPPVAQDPRYHSFADQRGWLGVPNFWNVASNLPFALAGAYGIRAWAGARWHDRGDRWPWLIIAAASILIGVGSGYYHWKPSDATLFWDRLPMTFFFMGMLAAAIAERIHARAGLLLLLPFLALGATSVEVWRRAGDLRFYALVQFYPMIALPAILWLFPSRYSHGGMIWRTGGYYALAKVAEHFDRQLFALTGGAMSGHAIKHFLGAFAVFTALRMLRIRGPAG